MQRIQQCDEVTYRVLRSPGSETLTLYWARRRGCLEYASSNCHLFSQRPLVFHQPFETDKIEASGLGHIQKKIKTSDI